MSDVYDSSWFAKKLSDRTIRGIALETSALIRAGALPVGAKLPPIRDLAYSLNVSPATISEAWSELRRQKIITGRGRNGTWVSGDRFIAKPERLASAGHYGTNVLDLTMAVPDPTLLPPLEKAMAYGASAEGLNSYERSRILPELEAEVRKTWPYDAEAFLAMNGGYNAVYTAIHALVTPGAPVAIEEPTAMRLLDILEHQGARILPVKCDENGPVPSSLQAAMRYKPVVFLFQPRLHSVTGHTVTPERMDELADVLRDSDAIIIEDDGIADIASTPRLSLGTAFPDRVIHVLSFSKTLGPDLRLAVMSSTKPLIEQVQSYRSFSAAWTSRVLQAAGSWLLRQPETEVCVANARANYKTRRDSLASALRDRGLPTPDGEGLCLWVPVVSESFAMVTLAARNIAVVSGKKFHVTDTGNIRVATSMLCDDYEKVADAIALAHVM
ncbi:PLP-dependent aminotransferase family protein [Agrobacterium larrymoorei]|uniref:aminotransferase-like domain-containing protein n=1 Tax=Agrobacterium larrymoorei TaxID=160699 RepID=UPI0015734673|nr:PLP-dependent aminotransferase family protein [Agrobacterium larrymoorei]NTJ43795.1 PLP-dependent aminotransferase family protein [Agrobacterium larrymoorei]